MQSRGWGKILVSTRLEKHISARFFQCWNELIQRGLRPGDATLVIAGRVAHAAQNDVVRYFLTRGEWDTLLTLDSDADVAPDFLERFRTYEPGFAYDILQAFYPRRGWPPRAIWMKRNVLGEMMECFITDPNTVEDVDMVGTHACLFRREVFTQMLGDADVTKHDWFFYPRHLQHSEDGAFSREAQEAGFRLGATTAVRAGHVTEITTNWDTYQQYLEVTGRLPLIERYSDLAHEIATFTGETAQMVIAKSISENTTVRKAWQAVQPQGAQEERAFYGATDNGYLYDLLYWNCSPLYEQILAPLRNVNGQRVLVIGCGLGTEADAMADRNEVDVFELPGVLKDFATQRLEKRVHWLEGDTLAHAIEGEIAFGEYDLVVAIDTLEHIHPDELDEVLEAIDKCLKPNGSLYAHNNFGQQDTYPMHHDHSQAFAAWCERVGMKQIGEYLWRLTS